MSHAAEIIARPPGHARVLGGPRSGKTSVLVERFHHLRRAGHQPLVVAFGREQRDRLLEVLVPPGTARFGPVPVTTHGLLATRLVATGRPNRSRALRDVDERVVLDRVLAARADLLRSDLRSIASSATLRDELLRVLHLLAQNGVTPAQAHSAAKKSDDERARDVLHVFAAYVEHLRERGLVTFYDAAWEAARAVSNDPMLAAKAGVRDVVLVDDAHDLDAGQFALLGALAPAGGPVALELFGDTSGPRFSFRGTSDRFLTDEFPAAYGGEAFHLGPPRPTDVTFAACLDALRGLPAASTPAPAMTATASLPLFAAAPVPQPHTTGRDWNVRVHAVRARDEVAEAHHATRCVGDWLARGISAGDIIVVARDPARMAAVLGHAFRERGIPIDTGSRADSAADAFVHALVGALGRDGDGQFAAALESSPLLAPFCAARDAGAKRDVARIVAALRAAHATRDGFDLERLLRDSLAAVAPAGTIERIAGEWNRYAGVVNEAGGHASLDEFRHMYMQAAAREPGSGGAVALIAARASSGRTARAAVVLGCADGLFPRVEVDGGYLPFAALSYALSGVHPGAARDFHARTDRERAEREEDALLLSTLLCASEEICISHPVRSGDQALTLPPVLAPLFERVTDVVDRDTAAAFRAATLVARSPADAALAGAARVADTMSGGWIAPPGPPRRPRFDHLALSPSRLETFSDCERKFFFQRILRIEEPATIYLTIGSIFHDVLKELITVGASGDEVRAALDSDHAVAVIDRVIADKMPDAGDWLRGLTRVHMRLMLDGVRELEGRRQGRYRVLSVETDARVPADGDAVLAGRVDRIDDMEGVGPVVIDYKTSAQLPKTAASILQGIEKDRDYWQVVVYSALAGALGHNAKAFVYYVVPPGEEVNALGVQLVPGNLPHVIPGGGRFSRYDPMPPALLREVLDDAIRIHGEVLSGACEYARTEDLATCGNCHFIHVCRRTGA